MTMGMEMDKEKEAADQLREQVLILEKVAEERGSEMERLRGGERRMMEEAARLKRERDAALDLAGEAGKEKCRLESEVEKLEDELGVLRRECDAAAKEIVRLGGAAESAEQGFEAARRQIREAMAMVEERDIVVRECEESLESCMSELKEVKARLAEAESEARGAKQKVVESDLIHREAERRREAQFEEEMSLMRGSHAEELAKMEVKKPSDVHELA